MRKNDVACGLVLAGIAGVLWTQTIPEAGGVAFQDDVDPLLYPRIIIALLGILGLALAFRGGFAKDGGSGQGAIFTRRTIGISACLACYAAVFTTLGFFLSSLFGGASVAWMFGWRKPVSLMAVALGSVAVIWFLFTKVLRIPLPSGIFF